jgi:hypothetical protein
MCVHAGIADVPVFGSQYAIAEQSRTTKDGSPTDSATTNPSGSATNGFWGRFWQADRTGTTAVMTGAKHHAGFKHHH